MQRERITKRALAVLALVTIAAAVPADDSESSALSVAREVERIAHERSLWPGWDPLATPLAVYDGERTYLFRHPAPPDGFTLLTGAEPPALAYEGRHPAVAANTSTEIGGVATATVLADGAARDLDPTQLATVALHESFHVFQRARHPTWQGDEGALLVYPVDDASLLALRRLETEALRRALAADDEEEAACWAGLALSYRAERFAAMDEPFVAYEHGTEHNEGLAAYVQIRADDATSVEIPATGFAASAVRLRAYSVGPALALLLDRFRPAWRTELEEDDTRTLEGLLAEALPDAAGADPASCGLGDAEIVAIRERASADANAVAADRVARRARFDAASGWRVVVEAASAEPLWPQGFDPLNVEVVDGGLLHTRFLRVGNDAGQLEAIDGDDADIEALTVAAGAHPLFEGVRRVIVRLPHEPRVVEEEGVTTLVGPGLSAHFARATVQRSSGTITVELEPGTDTAEEEAPPDLDALEQALRENPTDLRTGTDYRQAAIVLGAYDRAISLFQELVQQHPESPDLLLNLGFARVDKLPEVGAVNQVILSNAAIEAFGKAIELEDSWLARYSRGAAYVYWPPVFGHAPKAIADLERAVEIADQGPIEPYHVRHWIALGDAWWRAGDLEKSREVWRQGLERHPGDPQLEARLAAPDDETLIALLEEYYALGRRVDTTLTELWKERD